MALIPALAFGMSLGAIAALVVLNVGLRQHMYPWEWQIICSVARRKVFFTAICFAVVFGVCLLVLVTNMRNPTPAAVTAENLLMTQLGLLIMILAAGVHFYEIGRELRQTKIRRNFRRAWLALQIAPFVVIGILVAIVQWWLHYS